MRTRITGRWVIGYDGGHRIIEGGEIVYEDGRILFVGRGYAGSVDHSIDAGEKFVGPGLINLHAVANVDLQVFRIDLDTQGYPKQRAWVERLSAGDVLDEAATEASARFSVACILRGGATTLGAITTMAPKRWEDPPYEPEQIARAAGEFGARAYVAHQYRAYVNYWDGTQSGSLMDEARAFAGLDRATAFARRIDGTYDGRVRAYMFPYTLDASTPDLLRASKAAADALGTHLRTHFSQSIEEVETIQRRYGKTPVEYLAGLGVLDRNVILTHALHIAGNGPYEDPQDNDLRLLAEAGVSVCHCPVVYLRRGRTLRSFHRYRKAGINLGLGTDTFPQDMLQEMRYAALVSKVEETDPTGGTAAAVYTKAAARRLNTRVRMHFAQSRAEVERIRAWHGTDPVSLLEDIGFLGPDVILTHARHIAEDDDTDLDRLARSGVHIAHCPVVMRRTGRLLHSFSRYRRAGLNVGLGTDTFPPDMLEEMRWASIGSKLADRHAASGLAREVFEAATVGGARALGRDDLGRLAAGTKADVTVVDFRRLLIGPDDDPIRSLVHYAVQEDVEHVYIDGRRVVESGRVLGLDERQTLRDGERLVDKMASQFARWSGEPAGQLFPRSFPTG